MPERPNRSRVGEHPRAATETEWEVFVREETTDPLRHVGSITAPDAEVAYEQGAKLFGWYAADIWVCRAGDVHRFSTHDLDEDAEQRPVDPAGEPRSHE